MSARFDMPLHEEGIGELFSQLVDDGKTLARAEIELVKAGAAVRLARAKIGLVLAVLAFAILHLSLIAGWVMLGIWIWQLFGPGPLGAVASALIMLIGGGLLAYVLVRAAVARIKPAFAPLPGGQP